ncbi:hypothetical protein BDQ17DRAFT_1399400 [Cyathus striatus]|nr:hypothetical protein BDQ17DRAFT_1399400 [Cyathus striatus]
MAPSVATAIQQDTEDFIARSNFLLRERDLFHFLSPVRFGMFIWDIFYIFVQSIIIAIFKPPPPKSPDHPKNPYGRIAVIGAGLTGVSSAAHAIAHNFDVVIYEAGSHSSLGGIWAHVNKSSGLQLNSLLYRFHPAVLWSRAFPLRDEIVGEIERIWKEYHLEPRTRFETPVTSVKRAEPSDSFAKDHDRSRWIINDGADGPFDAIIVTVGTCGKAHWISLPGMPKKAGYEDSEKQQQPNRQKNQDASNGPTQDTSLENEDDFESDNNHGDQGDDQIEEKDRDKEKGKDQDQDEVKGSHVHSNEHKTKHRRNNRNKRSPKQNQHAHLRRVQSANGNEKQRPGSPSPSHSAQNNDDSEDIFTKTIVHSSQLDSPSFQLKGGERVVVIGSGASGVEAVETVLDRFGSAVDAGENERRSLWKDVKLKAMVGAAAGAGVPLNSNGVFKAGAKAGTGAGIINNNQENDEKGEKEHEKKGVEISLIARTDKWVIPRNIAVDTFLAAQPFGRQMPLSFLWEWFLTKWQYRGVENLVPQETGIFEGTPVVNDVFLEHVRSGRCRYIRGEPVRLTKDGVLVNSRKEQAKSATAKTSESIHDVQKEELVNADVIVLATGFEKPDIDFLPKDLFPDGYQTRLVSAKLLHEDWSILMTNSVNTRILLTLLMDSSARPSPKDMKLWVDVLRFIKRGATRGALGFFTYMELTIWLLGFHILRPDRLRWLFFIMNGWGVYTKD